MTIFIPTSLKFVITKLDFQICDFSSRVVQNGRFSVFSEKPLMFVSQRGRLM